MEYRSAEVRPSRMILLHDYTHHIQKNFSLRSPSGQTGEYLYLNIDLSNKTIFKMSF